MSNLGCVYLVVLGVCAEKPNVHNLQGIVYFDDKSMLVARDVEYDAIVRDDTRGRASRLDIVG